MSISRPSVSVICPIRNEAVHIGDCLTAFVNQTFPLAEMEILVIDGMSDDGTRRIVRQFQKKHPNIRLIDNLGKIVPKALNIGIREARGKYILRMDGHAKPAADYVGSCVKALENHKVDCVGGPIMSVNTTTTGKSIAAAMSSKFGVGNAGFRTSSETKSYVDTLAFPAFRREVFTKYGLFDEEMVRCQDDEFNFRIRHAGGKILLTPTIRSWYYPRAGFRKLWRQYFGYGFWKVRVLQKHFWLMQARHFVPMLLVSGLALTLTAGFFSREIMFVFGGLLSLYVLSATLTALETSRANGGTRFTHVLLAFFILHFSYGSGFLWGLLKFFPRWFQRLASPAPRSLKTIFSEQALNSEKA